MTALEQTLQGVHHEALPGSEDSSDGYGEYGEDDFEPPPLSAPARKAGGAGDDCGFFDATYKDAGAQVMSRSDAIAKSNILFSINAPQKDFHKMRGKGCVSWVGRRLPAGKEIVLFNFYCN